MSSEEKLVIEEKVVKMLKTVFDPEIPVDIYNLLSMASTWMMTAICIST